MSVLSLVAVGVVGTVLCIILRQHKPEFSLFVSLLVGMLILGAVISALQPVFESLNTLTEAVSLSSVYGQVLLKSLAVCFITQMASESCRDAGESAIASKLEMAGKAAVVVLALPLFESLVSMVTSLIEGS